jgi:hypothetical protein
MILVLMLTPISDDAVYDIGDRMTRYRGVPDIGVNIGVPGRVNVTRLGYPSRVSSDMTRCRVT